jgi:hypothetical protein
LAALWHAGLSPNRVICSCSSSTRPSHPPTRSGCPTVANGRSAAISRHSVVATPTVHPEVAAALKSIPTELLYQSGKVFYSGRAAFFGPSDLYILGLNPGGDPEAQASETISANLERFWEGPAWWSDYADESWHGAPPGTWGMAPRVLHMLASLDLDPRAVPASNVIFVRSSTEAALEANKEALLQACWPVHRAVIDALGIRAVLCFGGTAGRWVRKRLGAEQRIDSFQEINRRRWRSEAHATRDGPVVLTLTHPGRANWCNSGADPTCLVRRALAVSPSSRRGGAM